MAAEALAKACSLISMNTISPSEFYIRANGIDNIPAKAWRIKPEYAILNDEVSWHAGGV